MGIADETDEESDDDLAPIRGGDSDVEDYLAAD